MPIKINPKPTFSGTVTFIEIDGGECAVDFTFRHLTQLQLADWREQIDEHPIADSLLGDGVLQDDDTPLPFSPAEFRRFIEAYQPRGHFLAVGYVRALTEARVKNSGRSPAV